MFDLLKDLQRKVGFQWPNLYVLANLFVIFVLSYLIYDSKFLASASERISIFFASVSPSDLREYIIVITGFSLVNFALFRRWLNDDDERSEAEASASTERQVASTASALTREFEQRAKAAADAALSNIFDQADDAIKSEIRAKIDAEFGENIVNVLGDRLSELTKEERRINIIRRDSSDRFVQMRDRALQYADASERQARHFRNAGMNLAVIGLVVLGVVLSGTYYQYWREPSLLQQPVEVITHPHF